MSRDLKTFSLRVAALGAAACSSVYAVNSAPGKDAALVQSDTPLPRSAYDVELVGEDGRTLETYERGGRFYVMGQAGERYAIRLTNPTDRRVEAVISVDGLDVIDGENADFGRKRGYVVPPHGDLLVDGFRTSTTAVAAFRFSAVADSYADRKGKGRNVGVIGVAIFEEKGEPQMILPQASPPHAGPARDGLYGGDDKSEGSWQGSPTGPASGGSAGKGASPPPADKPSESVTSGTADATPARPGSSTRRVDADQHSRGDALQGPAKRQRPGLGTKFGEERYSAVDFTRFVRVHPTTPSAVAELRYNDGEGLRALGIVVQPAPDGDELMRRETADPFPSARGFAIPPQ